ncbi:metallophosphoesterase family protein [Solimonas terrae]|uniref:Metallophosphoesterase family protein n=1 Tax=Solimonas terrae TaxID=1396819 RepID=A0A6M2BUS6_9GAMM|nr:metallophosphoesterase family protein [Solimonas terrae]
MPDGKRRALLKAGAGALPLLLLPGCGSGSHPSTGGGGSLPPGTPAITPRGLHVSFTGDPQTTRTLSWFTDGSVDPGGVIEYGPVTPDMDARAIATAAFPSRAEGTATATYGVDALTHRATAADLPADLPLRYRVGSAQGWSAVQLLPAAAGENFRFCHFGDHAQNDASRAVRDGVISRAPDFTIIAGDLAYANGEQSLWDSYFDMLQPLAARIPIMTAPGNHEAKDGGGQGYSSRVAQPGKGTYYSWQYGRVHFVHSTGGSLLGSDAASAAALVDELLWLELDLASAALQRAAGRIDFIVFVQHYTIWTDDDGRNPANFELVALEEQYLLLYGVDLLLVGHDHIYERSKPMALGLPLPGGYVQVTQGGGGQDLYSVLANPASWSAMAVARHAFTELSVEAGRIKGTTWAVDDASNELRRDGSLESIDQFEIVARGATASAGFARSARPRSAVLADIDAVIAHTRQRNVLHDLIEIGGEHLGP